MSVQPSLRLRGLRKRFGQRSALDGVDLTLEGPQIVGIVGPDGAGKTTLLRAIAGLLEIAADEASVLGFDLRKDVRALKAQIGYVPQSFSLHRDLSVYENLRFTARLHRLGNEEFERRTESLLARTGLLPFADRPAGALSGGMKQKLSIANALLPEPALLALDEPTAGVDVMARDEIWRILEERRGKSLVLISTSYLDETEACDRLLYLDEGRVVAQGTPAELRAQVPVRLLRAWGSDPRAIAKAAGALPYVVSARVRGPFARIEIAAEELPGEARLYADFAGLVPRVRLLEPAPVDMESALLFLSRKQTQGTSAP
ncbi:MAG TPA: multidrug ABC transporter ATP-binding protein [Deltaproteobacteria bacterium]|nr:multidrug ABC transporter ATP-binding protein [Deltaproteobacteria bacterium]